MLDYATTSSQIVCHQLISHAHACQSVKQALSKEQQLSVICPGMRGHGIPACIQQGSGLSLFRHGYRERAN